jgi:membrane peptidoglycan carboxypeptidase
MRTALKVVLLVAVAGMVALIGAIAIWIYPEMSSLRGMFAASANSVYPPHIVQAFLAVEDPQFLDTEHSRHFGSATLVQQIVKWETFPIRGISRQFKEVIVAAVIERTIPKPQVVGAYLDHIYLGSVDGKALHGVPAAAHFYFGHSPDRLTLAEAAMLAGMVRSPFYYSPTLHPERAAARQQVVLARMRALQLISESEFADAMRATATGNDSVARH